MLLFLFEQKKETFLQKKFPSVIFMKCNSYVTAVCKVILKTAVYASAASLLLRIVLIAAIAAASRSIKYIPLPTGVLASE